MSNLSIGIVGLPNVGKSTLFNALLQKQAALAANYPFATIEPNVGIVPVPDPRLFQLQNVVQAAQIVPATVEFVDIAGLVAGAAQGAGLGNKFLAHIREVSVIAHVVRVFPDEGIIKEGSVDPAADFTTVVTELQLADLQTLDKQIAPKQNQPREMHERYTRILRWKQHLDSGQNISSLLQDEADHLLAKELALLTSKPTLIVANVGEEEISGAEAIKAHLAAQLNVPQDQTVVICAKLESEIAGLSPDDRVEYMQAVGLEQSGLEQLIAQAYTTLGLRSFYTAGPKEARAWTISHLTTAPDAAGVIHSDFRQHFIKAIVCSYSDFVQLGGWKSAREHGKVRQEGRDYIMKPDDVVEFMVGK